MTKLLKAFLLIPALLIFLMSLGQTSSDSTKSHEITILSYGFPGPELYEATMIAKKYNFKLISGGCIVSNELIDSMEKHNNISYKELDKLNGSNWKEKYEKEVQVTYSRDSAMTEALKKEKFIQDKYSEQVINKDGFKYFVDSALTNNIYRINVIGYHNKALTYVSFFRVFMKYDSLKIIRKEDNILPFDIKTLE